MPLVTCLGGRIRRPWFDALPLGCPTPWHSTLAEANLKRPALIFEEVFFVLLGRVRGGLGKAGQEMVRLIDKDFLQTWSRNRTH